MYVREQKNDISFIRGIENESLDELKKTRSKKLTLHGIKTEGEIRNRDKKEEQIEIHRKLKIDMKQKENMQEAKVRPTCSPPFSIF